MFRTLLVDDDFLVRTYLKMLGAWERAGYEVVRDVQDGEEALHALFQEPIDVVITDISMPVMDGIELIRRIRQEEKGIYIIVLSCHDDFEYVKEAMRLGADEYILKNTLDEGTLFEILEKSRQHIERQKKKNTEEERRNKLIRMGSHTLKYHFFNGILSGNLSGQEREKRRQEAGIEGAYQNSAVINMFMRRWNEREQDWTSLEADQYSQGFRHRLVEKMDELLDGDSVSGEIIYLGTGIFCCFLDLSSLRRSSVMRQRLTEAALACFSHCKKEPYEFGVGVSNICIGEEGIRQAYQQAREMMKYSFYDGSDILYYDCGREVGSSLPAEAEALYEQIEELISSRRKEALAQMWKEALSACEHCRTDGRILVQWLKRLDKKAGLERPSGFYGRFHRIHEIYPVAKAYGEELFEDRFSDIPSGISGAVRVAVQFINQNYKKPVSLREAAEAAGVNPAYLSYLFKQEMQIGFSNYLQECRMEWAKKLLRTTNKKIKDVALESGFHDYHYFSKTFKKLNQLSPADYRRDHGS